MAFLKRVEYIRKLYIVGISYRKADAATRGLFSISPPHQEELVQLAVARGIDGLVLVSTCNRTEIIGFAEHPFKLIELLSHFWNQGTVKEFAEVAYVYKSTEAIAHLFRLVAGLDSQILGDYEIVGQLKQAYQLSRSQGGINTYLDKLFSFLMHASKRVKNETGLSSGTTSVSYAAVQFLLQQYQTLQGKTVVVYGLGEIGRNTYRHLIEYAPPARVWVMNRSQDRLKELLADAPPYVKGCSPGKLREVLPKADILIVATSSVRPTVRASHIPANRPLTIIDLSVPGNVAPEVKTIPGVALANVDELSRITDATLAQRQQEVPLAEAIIEEEKKKFFDWLATRRFAPALQRLRNSLEAIRQQEMELLMRKSDSLTREDLEQVTGQMVQKIVRQFARHLKPENRDASQALELIYKVFDQENITAG